MAPALSEIAWRSVEPPLPPLAVAGHGVVGERLATRTTAAMAAPGATPGPGWTLVRFLEWSVVEGDDLPWVDGVTYLGLLPGTTEILVPVHRQPRLHPDLLVRAVQSLTGGRRLPGRLALLPHSPGTDRVTVLPLGYIASSGR